MTNTTIVAGPPCSGKNHYVDEHRGPDDVVIDWDAIAVEFGSPRTHHHPKPMYDRIAAEYERRLAEIEQNHPSGHVWIIRGLPEHRLREQWAARFDADVVVLTPPIEVLIQRAQQRRHVSMTEWAIRRWFDRAGKDPALVASTDPEPTPATPW